MLIYKSKQFIMFYYTFDKKKKYLFLLCKVYQYYENAISNYYNNKSIKQLLIEQICITLKKTIMSFFLFMVFGLVFVTFMMLLSTIRREEVVIENIPVFSRNRG